jgi:type II secretory pathway pseudopilin PulG
MLRAAAILALVWVAVASQPPSPTPAKPAQDQQNHGQSEQTKTSANEKNARSSTPSVDQSKAKVALRNQTEPEKQSPSATPQQQAVEIWPEATAITVAIATIALAGLAIWQSYLMRKGLAETAKAADAATKAANVASDTLRIGERAYLKTSGYHLFPKRADHIGSDGYVHLSFKIKNIGRTQAKIIECKADGAMAATVPESFPDPFESKSAGYSDGIIVWPGTPIPVGFDVFRLNVDIDWRDIQLHKLFVSVWGGVRYSDVFGVEHVTKFALVFYSDTLGDTPGTDRLFPPPGSGKFNDAT